MVKKESVKQRLRANMKNLNNRHYSRWKNLFLW